jgi:hypothetical protein
MPKIHLIERIANLKITNKANNKWDSYCWAIAEDTAAKLVGGQIYLHRAQDKPSHFGGTILSYRVLPEDAIGEHEVPGRIVFNFKATLDCKDVKAGKDGWGMEKKIVWEN